jgi:hypothetical protein
MKVDSPFRFSAPFRENVRNQICPRVLWAG